MLFKNDTELFCYVTGFDSEVRTWKRGYEQDLLTYNGATVNAMKFKETTYSNGFGLVIKHLAEEDVNMPYTCTYGFYEYTGDFTVNEQTFQLLPTNETLEKMLTYVDQKLTFSIQFKQMFPVPQCIFHLGHNNYSSNLVLSQSKVGLFYSVNVSLVIQLNERELCKINNITMTCTIGTTAINISDSLPPKTTCRALLNGSDDSSAIHTSFVIGYSIIIWFLKSAETLL